MKTATDVDILTEISVARMLLAERREDVVLNQRIAEAYPSVPLSVRNEPRLCLFRNIATFSKEALVLHELSQQLMLKPCILEYTTDNFYAGNDDKYYLLRPRIFVEFWGSGRPHFKQYCLADVSTNQGKTLEAIRCKDGQSLVDVHHRWLTDNMPDASIHTEEISAWLHGYGTRARDYYQHFLTLFLVHGILAEWFIDSTEESAFYQTVFFPAYQAVTERFGVHPLIVSLKPQKSDALGDLWWYPDASNTVEPPLFSKA